MIQTIAEIAGYLASVLLAISLLVTNDLTFRWVNTFGCITFIIYGVLIGASPIILTNSILVLINLFYLAKIYRTKENFDMADIKPNDMIVAKFLSFYKKDIQAYFPDFNTTDITADISFVVLRDVVITNIFTADIANENAYVKINYTIPKYRDYKVGKFIFEQEKKYLLSKGVKRIIYKKVSNKNHEHFLKVNGFIQENIDGVTTYIKYL